MHLQIFYMMIGSLYGKFINFVLIKPIRLKRKIMRLKRISIENFRCFKQYEVNFTSGITVFIGKNGAGKTSLLHAIRYGLSVFFSNDSSMGDDLLISGNPDLKIISTSPTDFYRDKNADLPTVDLTIGMEAEFNTKSLTWEYYKRSTSGASLFVSKYQPAYRLLMEEYHNSDQLPLFVFYSDSFPHVDTRTSDFAKRAIKEQGYMIRNFAYYKWNSEVSCTSIWQNRFINSMLKQISISDNDPSVSREVQYIKDKLRLFSEPINLTLEEDADFEIKDFFPVVDTELGLYLRLKDGRDILFESLPAGYKRLYSIAFDLAYRLHILRMRNEEDPMGIVMIDEIDLHLHPSLEQEVLDRFHRTFPSIQFIVSTHSPMVLSNLKVKNTDNMIYKMQVNETVPDELPNLYGVDYSSAVYDAMDTPYSENEVKEEIEAILRLTRRGKCDIAEKRKEELKSMVSDEQYGNIMSEIDRRLAED
jgi:predicted ATP-binding protein involved in virulence